MTDSDTSTDTTDIILGDGTPLPPAGTMVYALMPVLYDDEDGEHKTLSMLAAPALGGAILPVEKVVKPLRQGPIVYMDYEEGFFPASILIKLHGEGGRERLAMPINADMVFSTPEAADKARDVMEPVAKRPRVPTNAEYKDYLRQLNA